MQNLLSTGFFSQIRQEEKREKNNILQGIVPCVTGKKNKDTVVVYILKNLI